MRYLLDIKISSDFGKQLTPENYQLLSEIFPLIGWGILIICIILSYKKFSFMQNAVHDFATVTSMREVINQEGNNTLYAPIFTFIDAQGKTRTIKSATATSSPKYEVNQKIKIVYRADSPERALINSFYNIWFTSTILAIAGIFMLFMGFYLRLFF